LRELEAKSRVHAKALRRRMTEAEVLLWSQLRQQRLLPPEFASCVCRTGMFIAIWTGFWI
jgi:very-short-patch-repair endonuclease